ncbi:HDL307Cp [Eremothecium sinecaudum]|uniref:Ubiquitin carboxyl-terminal hydrolase n=1 Tax=Eremothecium sinecaudum TaxID=45286 RepID=A0A0X8HS09_9SACH|nr:HDL307Cp [Eremothecium sinecaudum]AMD20437.1 HDL307Cp [Eremothecium sinecaudum]
MHETVVPLESSPDVFTNFARQLGLNSQMAFHDIYSLTDPELLAFLTRPMSAIILLFPINELFESLKDHSTPLDSQSTPVIWFKQTINNACGMYALFHSLANNRELLEVDSKFNKYLSENKKADGRYGGKDSMDFVYSLSDLYKTNSQMGQTTAPDPAAAVDLHFITFVEHEGKVYELDGRKSGPLVLGSASSKDLVDEPLIKTRVKWYMDNADEKMKHQFSLLGLGPSWD